MRSVKNTAFFFWYFKLNFLIFIQIMLIINENFLFAVSCNYAIICDERLYRWMKSLKKGFLLHLYYLLTNVSSPLLWKLPFPRPMAQEGQGYNMHMHTRTPAHTHISHHHHHHHHHHHTHKQTNTHTHTHTHTHGKPF